MIKKLLILLLLCSSVLGQVPYQKPMMGQQIDYLKSTGLVAWWVMNEGTGATVQDLSGNGNDGNLVADTHWVGGKFGPCLSFDGSGDYVDLGEGEGITEGQPQITVSVWVKSNQNEAKATRDHIVIQDGVVILRWHTTEAFQWIVYNDSTYGLVTSNVHADTNWHHVVGVYNGTYVKLYIDGSEEGTPDDLSGNMKSGTAKKLDISWGTVYSWDGSIDDVMIYNRALSASEVAELYRNPFGMFRPTFSVWWYSGIGGEPPVTSIPIFMYHYLNH